MNTPDSDMKDFGRRMPFTVPDGYLDSLARQIAAAAEGGKAAALPRRCGLMKKLAVAASVALIVAAAVAVALRSPSVTLEDEADVYSALSPEDQDLIDLDYDDDLFLALTE